MRDDDLARMNEKDKNGKKYKFPNSFILIDDYVRLYFRLPYRQIKEELIKATLKERGFPQTNNPVIHKFAEEQTNWTLISMAA